VTADEQDLGRAPERGSHDLHAHRCGYAGVGLFMIMLDNTVVNVALPSISQHLGIGISELE
jgi:hypothetical protein